MNFHLKAARLFSSVSFPMELEMWACTVYSFNSDLIDLWYKIPITSQKNTQSPTHHPFCAPLSNSLSCLGQWFSFQSWNPAALSFPVVDFSYKCYSPAWGHFPPCLHTCLTLSLSQQIKSFSKMHHLTALSVSHYLRLPFQTIFHMK